MARVRNIGLPVNESERKGISYLGKELPDNHIVLTNMELPSRNGFPYEFDAIVIGEIAVYVVEFKGYKGSIRGNAFQWELFSGSIVPSPMPLLSKKAKIVADRIRSWFPYRNDIWVQQLLVLTDDKVIVQLQDPQSTQIKNLRDCVRTMRDCSGRSATIDSEMRGKIEKAIAGNFEPLKKDMQAGDYRLLEQVGRNDLYTTFIAEHGLLGGHKRYLLKIYTLKIYEDQEEQKKHRDRVLREARTLSELPPHPDIVKVYPPFPWESDRIVLPMEWVDGRSLRGLLDDKDGVDKGTAKKVLVGLCSAFSFVHGQGVVHRDVRPDNVLVCPDGTIRLVNFDCAHLGGQDMLTIATRVGRHLDERYVAPEVWMDPANASEGSDIYSLGIIFHELLTGRTPYQKVKDVLKDKKVTSSISELRPDLDKEADRLFSSMCAFDSSSRSTDLSEVRDWIEMLL